MSSKSLPSFSALAQSSAQGGRNLVNREALELWLNAIVEDKLPVNEQRDEREAKAERWIGSVARGWMLRKGETRNIGGEEALSLTGAKPWLVKALEEGRGIDALSLTNQERDLLMASLDWMVSQEGPPLSSDWSRVSVKQAVEAHDKWVEAMARAAKKRADQLGATPAMKGCEFACFVEGVDLDGWAWVKVQSEEALNREGSMMKHCVGGYAEAVKTHRKMIWSLRDPQGKPWITLEGQPERGNDGGMRVIQIKASSNQVPRPAHAKALHALFAHFKSVGFVVTRETGLSEMRMALAPDWAGSSACELWEFGSKQTALKALSLIKQTGDEVDKPEAAGLFSALGYIEALEHLAITADSDEASKINAALLASSGKMWLAPAGIFGGVEGQPGRRLWRPEDQEEMARLALSAREKHSSLSAPMSEPDKKAAVDAFAWCCAAKLSNPARELCALINAQDSHNASVASNGLARSFWGKSAQSSVRNAILEAGWTLMTPAGSTELILWTQDEQSEARAKSWALATQTSGAPSSQAVDLMIAMRYVNALAACCVKADAQSAMDLTEKAILGGLDIVNAAIKIPDVKLSELLPMFYQASLVAAPRVSCDAANWIISANDNAQSLGGYPKASQALSLARSMAQGERLADEIAQSPVILNAQKNRNASSELSMSSSPFMADWLKDGVKLEPEAFGATVYFVIHSVAQKAPTIASKEGERLTLGLEEKMAFARVISQEVELGADHRRALLNSLTHFHFHKTQSINILSKIEARRAVMNGQSVVTPAAMRSRA